MEAFQSSTCRSTPSSARVRWTMVALGSAGPDPVSLRGEVKGTPDRRAPFFPGASPTRAIGAAQWAVR